MWRKMGGGVVGLGFMGLFLAASFESLDWQRVYADSHASSIPENGQFQPTWITSMAASPTRFVAVLQNGYLITSPDRKTWAPLVVSPKPRDSVAYGSGAFVFLSFNSDDSPEGGSNAPYYSTDGLNWLPGRTTASQPFKTTASYLKFGANRFLILGSDTAAVSANGVSWQQLPLINNAAVESTLSLNSDSLFSTPFRFFALGEQIGNETSHPALFSSTDGQHWSPAGAANAPGHLVSAEITYPETENGPQVVTRAGFVNLNRLAVSTDGRLAVVAGEYADEGTYASPYRYRKVAVAASANFGVSWTVIPAASQPFGTAFGQPYDEEGYFSLNMALTYWKGRFFMSRIYDRKDSLMPFFTSSDGSNWTAATGLQVGDRPNPPEASSYIDSMLSADDGLYAATSFYPNTNISGTSDDLEFVTIARVPFATPTPTPGPTVAPTPVATPVATPKPAPTPDPGHEKLKQQLAALKKQLKSAKKIKNPDLRAKKVAQLKKKIKQLQKKLK